MPQPCPSSSAYQAAGSCYSTNYDGGLRSTVDGGARHFGVLSDDRLASPGRDATYHGNLRGSNFEHLQTPSRRFSLDSDFLSQTKSNQSRRRPAYVSPTRGPATSYPQHSGLCNCASVLLACRLSKTSIVACSWTVLEFRVSVEYFL